MLDITDQIKERINVVDLIGEYLKLEKAGSNWKALCPFHNEKTPSFMVNPERNFWYCFGCQKGGDIFSFLMEMEGIEFREALERLAEKAGVELPRYNLQVRERVGQKQRVLALLEEATQYYEEQWRRHPQAVAAREYLQRRNISEEVRSKFRVGFAPAGWENSLNFFKNKGYQEKEILAAGLLVKNEKGRYYDRFRHRIIFPVFDIAGKVVGYSARAMPNEDQTGAKYINTPQTIVYDKSQVLYGIFQAKTAIKKLGSAVIVEGNLDVMASHQAGMVNVVAVSGTALTEEHLKTLKRLTNAVQLCFDADVAGQQATIKSLRICLRQDMDTGVIILPSGYKDVGELVEKDPAKWKKVAEQPWSVMEFLFQAVLKKFDKDTPRGKRMIAYELLNFIKDIANPVEQSYWLKKLAEKLEIGEEVLADTLKKTEFKKTSSINSDGKRENENKRREGEYKKEKPKEVILQERLLGLFSLFPEELKESAKELKKIWQPEIKALFEEISQQPTKERNDKVKKLEMEIRYSYSEEEGILENEIDPLEEWEQLKKQLLEARKKALLQKLSWDIKRAEEAGDEESLRILLEEFKRCIQGE